MFKVIFYKDSKGNEPVREYLVSLKAKSSTSKQDRIKFTKITAYMQSLQEYGTRIGNPTVKHIDGDIWELRPLSDRIFGKMIPLFCCTISTRKHRKHHKRKLIRQPIT